MANIQLPLAFYNISSYGNNLYLEIYVRENDEIIIKSTILILEDGVYNAILLINKINNLLSTKEDEFAKVQFGLDLDEDNNGTGKTIIETNDENNTNSIELEKNLESLPDQVDIKTKLGWNLDLQGNTIKMKRDMYLIE